MRRVAYLGNFSSPLTTESQVAAGLERAGAEVLRVDVGDAARNPRRAQSAVRGADVGLVLYTRTHNATALRRDWTPFWRTMEERGARTAGVHLDQFCAIPARRAWMARGGRRDAQFSMQFMFTADGGHNEVWAQYGIEHHWLPAAVAPEALLPGPAAEGVPPVVFVGSTVRYHNEHRWRQTLIEGLRRRYGADFRVYGYGAEGGTVRGAALSEVLRAARVVVGDVFGGGRIARYWSDRVPETLARGATLVHPDVPGLAAEYPDCAGLVLHEPLNLSAVYAAVDGALRWPRRVREERAAVSIATVRARHLWEHRAATLLAEVAR